MKTETFIRKFAYRDALLRAISLLGGSFTIAAVSILPGFGVDGLLIASSIQVFLTAALDLPTSLLADRIGRSRLLKLSLYLKLLVSIALLFSIYFSEQNNTRLIWIFFVFEALIDSVANSLLSGTYQISYLSLYESQCKVHEDETRPSLFLESFRYSKKMRLIFPVIFSLAMIGIIQLLKEDHSNLYNASYVILGLILLGRIYLIGLISKDFSNTKSFKDSSDKKIRAGLSEVMSSIKESPSTFINYGLNNLISLMTLFYLTGDLMKVIASLNIAGHLVWTTSIAMTVMIYLLRTQLNIFFLPKISKDEFHLTIIAFPFVSVITGIALVLSRYFIDTALMKLGFTFISVIIGYALFDSSSKSIESNIRKYVRHEYLSSWISSANLIGYLAYGVLSLILLKVKSEAAPVIIGSVFVLYGAFLFFNNLTSKSKVNQLTFNDVFRLQVLKSVSMIVGLFLVIDITSFYFISVSKRDEVIDRTAHTIFLGAKPSIIQGNSIDGINFMSSLKSGNFISCYMLNLNDQVYNNCSDEGVVTSKLAQKKIIFTYDEVGFGDGVIYVDQSSFIKGLIDRAILDFFLAILLYTAFFQLLKFIFKKFTQEVEKLPRSITDGNAETFKVAEFKAVHKQLLESISVKEELLKSKTQSDLARQVSHDIKAPLAILNSVTFVDSDNKELVVNSLARINSIANDLLDFKENFRLEFITVEDLLRPIIEEKKFLYPKTHPCEIEVEQSGLMRELIQVESKECRRMFSNLLNNAFESQLAKESAQIQIGVSKVDGTLKLHIKDRGHGISQEMIENMGIEQKTSKQSGNGLGLYHAFHTMKKLRGRITVTNLDNQGTEITLEFMQKKIEKIVLIDDDKLIHLHWKKEARRQKVVILNFLSFEEFLNSHEENEIAKDVSIYVDFNLNNNLNGIEVARKLSKMGFLSLHLASGIDNMNIEEHSFLSSIQGKEFPVI